MENKYVTPIDDLVLETILEIVSTPQRESASTIDVAQKLKLPIREVKNSFLNLAEKGFVNFDNSIQCATPLINPPARTEGKSIEVNTNENRILKNVFKVIGGAIITFLIWYFGLSPNSSNILPISFGKPIQIYSVYFYEGINDLVWKYWKIDDVDKMKSDFSQDNQISRFSDTFSDATKVTISGFVTFSFDVENSAKFSQANLVEIVFEAQRESVSQMTEIYQFPPTERGGAGVPMDYEATIEFDLLDSASEIQTFLANPGLDQDFEFITLSPGERETINVNIMLPEPGHYRLTPIARFRYEDKHYEHQFETLEVLFPQKYRVWFISNNGRGILSSNNFAVGRTNDGLYVENLIQQPYHERLSFNSTLSALNASLFNVCKKFVVVGENVTLSSIGANECLFSDTNPQEAINPEIQSIIVNTYNKEYSEVAISPNGENIAIVLLHESKLQNNYRYGNIVIFNQATIETANIFSSNVWCDSPVWSPSGRNLAFLCRQDDGDKFLDYFDPTELWITDIYGKAFAVQLDTNHQYQNPNWSEDESQILLGGNGFWIISIEPPNDIVQVFDIPDCDLCIKNPSWEP